MPTRCLRRAIRGSLAGCSCLLLWTAALAADPEVKAPAAAEAPTPEAATRSPAPKVTVELPSFQSGLWEYRRTVIRAGAAKPQVSAIRRCGDPGAEMREKMASLKKKGCQFAPLKRSNERYISSWTCQTPTGAMRFRDVLSVHDVNGYQVVSETHTAQHVTQQKIEAARLGECPSTGAR